MHSHNMATPVRTANSLQLVIDCLHAVFFFHTHIRSKKFVQAGLGSQDGEVREKGLMIGLWIGFRFSVGS